MYGASKRRPKTGRYSDPHRRFPESVGKVGEIEQHLTAKDTKVRIQRRLAERLPVENADDWSPCRWSMDDLSGHYKTGH